ncbi:hypothetical protein F9278_14745 [Streptomyces phaeolivaceus]|uniref:Uncharacterized protein n=1 Tax=Streptomyces phaeolivaceus TaxID=2653200 RepID=A0A5P8K3B2_9ACTN|nr:hypothetical protein F9278_14745 [Streptomyces phaeolivaceus]
MNRPTASHRGGDDMAQRHREPVGVHLILRRGGEVLLSRRAGDTYALGLPGNPESRPPRLHLRTDPGAAPGALNSSRLPPVGIHRRTTLQLAPTPEAKAHEAP